VRGNLLESIFVGKPVLKIIFHWKGLTQGYSRYGGYCISQEVMIHTKTKFLMQLSSNTITSYVNSVCIVLASSFPKLLNRWTV